MHKEKYWHGRNVFITGINGFIGGNLAKSLIDKGANVFGLLRNHRKDTFLYFEGISDKITLINGDITDFTSGKYLKISFLSSFLVFIHCIDAWLPLLIHWSKFVGLLLNNRGFETPENSNPSFEANSFITLVFFSLFKYQKDSK